jgi:glycerol kinase
MKRVQEMASLILAIDQGTTSSRALIVNDAGEIIGLAQEPVEMIYPKPGWVNQNATNIWETTLRVCHAALTNAGATTDDVAAIGITNQRETTVVWDPQTLAPLAPAIVWQSRQSATQVDAIHERGMADRYTEITGLVPDAYFSATKLKWLFEQDAHLLERAHAGTLKVGTIDSWLVANLSGGSAHITDVSNASRTMLFDIRSRVWSDELLGDLGIPRQILPEVVANVGHLAETDPALFGRAIPIMGIAGDQQAALFGQACYTPGRAKNTYGTGSFLLMQTGTVAPRSRHRLLSTIAWEIDDQINYALEGSILVSGSAVGWLRDGLELIESSSDIGPLAATVPDSGGVHMVPALTGLGAPYWDPDARGAILGITRGTTRAHIARATLEGIALQVVEVAEAMQADSGIALTELRVDGGASSNDLLMQIQADLLGVPIVRPVDVETTALGAAYLAGLGSGVWTSLRDIERIWAEDRRFEPAIPPSERENRLNDWKAAVARIRTHP